MPKVYFIGAGPGDPELMTIKGRSIIESADLIIYAGSLVNPAVLDYAKPDCVKHNSASMNLEAIIDMMATYIKLGRKVARLHTGEPSLYGAIAEQMSELDKLGVEYEVIPGVSSAFAAAAALKCELTLPDVNQTVIFTRIEGRTGVPAKESLRSLAAHGTTMVIFLSVGEIEKVVSEIAGGYPASTPAAVVYKASWPGEEKVVRGTLADIAEKTKAAGISKTALILVGQAIGSNLKEYSKLYDKSFGHEFRAGNV